MLIHTVVELNLRLPSMLHGKKGFERIAWAFRNVLTESVAWLFCDLASESNGLPKGSIFEHNEALYVSDMEKKNIYIYREYTTTETST